MRLTTSPSFPHPEVTGRVRKMARSARVYSPAGLSLLRLVGALPLAALSLARRARLWCALAILLILSDLADGIIARRIGDPAATRTQRGFDHLADAVMHVVLPISALWLRPTLAWEERRYILVLAAAQTTSMLAC